MGSMADVAATVPWKESIEQHSTEASLETLRNDTRRKQQELHETISFHKQYREAVVKANDCLREIEEKLADKDSLEDEMLQRSYFEVRARYFDNPNLGNTRLSCNFITYKRESNRIEYLSVRIFSLNN